MSKVVSREWLNKPDTEYTSFIMWSVDYPEKSAKKSKYSPCAWARLKIADCNKSLEFALDMENKNIKGTVNKLQILIDELTKLKSEVMSAYDEQFALEKEHATKEKEKDARKSSQKAKKAS
jgi:hypothetical protein